MIKTLTKKIASWQKYNRTVRELSMLSDRDLSDLGFVRDDIKWVAAQHK